MKILYLFVLTFLYSQISISQQSIKFGVIGDYGNAGPDELAVANLIKSWNPDFIITVGDNNYDIGSPFTIDENIGQYFHEFIFPYKGTYGQGDTVNRFFTSLGNCDWGTPNALPYREYFTLPGNERYYDFVKGPVHFFVIDSDTNEYDGRDSNSIQGQLLKNSLANSSSRFNIIYFHHAPYCSGLIHGSEPIMRLPFKKWGASAVLSGHEHLYERLNRDGLTYFVNGLGGNLRTPFGFPISGSQVRYNSNYGAMLVNAYPDSMIFKFYNITNSLRDNFKILPVVKSLNLTLNIEGFYNSNTNSMVGDTVKIYLRNNNSPYSIMDSSKGFLNSSGLGTLNFSKANNATNYYLVVIHRNSVETWSAEGLKFSANVLNYNFTTSSSQAFGNNLKLKGAEYCIFSGDVNQDGLVDVEDYSLVDNAAELFASGYIPEDLNGDNFIDISDVGIADDNVYNFVSLVSP
ncbi:MAG: metallophosphoesterase [bacterium]